MCDSVPDETKETQPECLDSVIEVVLFSLPSVVTSTPNFPSCFSDITSENLGELLHEKISLLGEEKSSVEDGELVI